VVKLCVLRFFFKHFASSVVVLLLQRAESSEEGKCQKERSIQIVPTYDAGRFKQHEHAFGKWLVNVCKFVMIQAVMAVTVRIGVLWT
jgi:hypothetical protein